MDIGTDAPYAGGALIISQPEGADRAGAGFLGDFFGLIPTLSQSALDVDHTWGEIRGARAAGDASPPPQPTERNLSGPDEEGGLGALGLSLGSVIAGVLAAVGIYAAGGNWAWTIIGGLFVAVVAAWLMG